MSISDLPVLQALRAKMKWHQARQTVLAQNVANADTPDYQAKDLRPLSFRSALMSVSEPGLRVTDPKHIPIAASAGETAGYRDRDDSDFDITPSGNSVVLEEQMMKVAQNQMDHQAAASLYSKSIGLLRMAIGQNQR